MHHRDGPTPTAEHPPVLIKVEAADVRCPWVVQERNGGGASWDCRPTAPLVVEGSGDGQPLLTS